MTKEKVMSPLTNGIKPSNDIKTMFSMYAPILISLIALLVCYLLYKKFQTVNSTGDSILKIEEQFTTFIKEQSDINMVNSKKFNAVITQINQVNYVLQNSFNTTKEQNTIETQLSPERPNSNKQAKQENITPSVNTIVQPPVRELLPTSVISTNFPVSRPIEDIADSKLPISTVNKVIHDVSDLNMSNKKRNAEHDSRNVIEIEDTLIEEISSSEED